MHLRGFGITATTWRLNPVWHRIFCSGSHMAAVGVKGLMTQLCGFLIDVLRDPSLSNVSFRRLLKTWLFSEY